jgi:hypothetical protein
MSRIVIDTDEIRRQSDVYHLLALRIEELRIRANLRIEGPNVLENAQKLNDRKTKWANTEVQLLKSIEIFELAESLLKAGNDDFQAADGA